MVLKLHGCAQFACTRRVGVILHEKQVPFQLIEVAGVPEGKHKTPEYLKIQPFGQTPYIDDDGFFLYESRAVSKYIATKYANQGTKLIPDDLKKAALAEQAASVESFNFDPIAHRIISEVVFKPFYGAKPDEAVVADLVKQLGAKLDAYEAILSRTKYLAGDEVTLGDLFHLPYGALFKPAGVNILEDKSRPNVARWWMDITSRPSWQAVAGGVKSTA